MSLESYESSRHAGEPVDLYLFTWGPGEDDYYGYTDAETEVVHDGKTYTPRPMRRDEIESSGTLDRSTLAIGCDIQSDLASLFLIYPPTQQVSLVIRQGHIGDPDAEFLVIWSGRVLAGKYEGSEVELHCEPVATSMRRAGLRRHWQYGCPHALYQGDENGGCRASKAAASYAGTVSATSGTQVTLTAGWNGAIPKAKFAGGLLEWTNEAGATETRRILRIDGETLTLGGLVRDLEASDAVTVVLHCNHQMDDCADLHDNILDFGGQPWIPGENPFSIKSQFY